MILKGNRVDSKLIRSVSLRHLSCLLLNRVESYKIGVNAESKQNFLN